MKWQLVLKVESKKGNTEEHVIGTGYGPMEVLRILVREKKEYPVGGHCFLKPKQQKDILKKTQDIELVTFILNTTDINLNESILEELFKKFNHFERFQKALIGYCFYNKKGLYKKFAQKCTLATDEILYFDSQTRSGT